MNKRQLEAQETRRKIYEIGCRLIEEKGFQNVSVEDITKACGVAKGTFYVYFKRKEEIVFECCSEWFKEVDRMAREHKGGLAEKLTVYFKGFMEGVTCGGIELCRQWVREVIDPKEAPGEMCGGKYVYDLKHMRAFLKDAVKEGLLKKSAPVEELARLFLCELYGMMTCWCMSDAEFVPEEWVNRLAKVQLSTLLEPYLTKNEITRSDK